jgi:hypothetical protein
MCALGYCAEVRRVSLTKQEWSKVVVIFANTTSDALLKK